MQAPQSNTASAEASSTPSFFASIRAAASAQQQNSETPEALISSPAEDPIHGLPDVDREPTSTAAEGNRPIPRAQESPSPGYLDRLSASRYARGNGGITDSLPQSSYSTSRVGLNAFPPTVLSRLIQSANADRLRRKDVSSVSPFKSGSERLVAPEHQVTGPHRLENLNASPLSGRPLEFAYPALNRDDRDHGENNSPSPDSEFSLASLSERCQDPPLPVAGTIEDRAAILQAAHPSFDHHALTHDTKPRQEQCQRDQLTRAGLAHDAKNLLSALKLYSELLALPQVLPEHHRHYASDLRSIAERSEKLIEDLIAFRVSIDDPRSDHVSQIGTAQATPPARSSASEALLELGGLLKTLACGRLQITLGPQADLPIPISSSSLERVLINLVNNAAKATIDRGAIRIRVGALSPPLRVHNPSSLPAQSDSDLRALPASPPLTASESNCPDTIVLTVDDSGCGMTEEQICALETPGIYRDEQRHGIGMQVVRSLVEASHGTLAVHSRIGVGTRVEVRWPIVDCHHPALTPRESAQTIPTHRPTPGDARLPQTLDLSSSTPQTIRSLHTAHSSSPTSRGKGAIAC